MKKRINSRSVSKLVTLALFGAMSVFMLACSKETPKPDPGRCITNMDCPKGQQCNDTRCEDLYFPRRLIKIN